MFEVTSSDGTNDEGLTTSVGTQGNGMQLAMLRMAFSFKPRYARMAQREAAFALSKREKSDSRAFEATGVAVESCSLCSRCPALSSSGWIGGASPSAHAGVLDGHAGSGRCMKLQ